MVITLYKYISPKNGLRPSKLSSWYIWGRESRPGQLLGDPSNRLMHVFKGNNT